MITVLGVVVFVCHSWSVLGFLNRLSAFIFYFHVAEIAEIFAFMMAFALLESLLITGLLALLGAVLPSTWLRDGFAYKGFIVMIIATTAMIIFQKNLKIDLPHPQLLILNAILPVVLIVIVLALVQRMPRAQRILRSLADRLSIMLFVYVPLGLLSLVVVTLGNLL